MPLPGTCSHVSWERRQRARGDATEGGTPALPGAGVTPEVNRYAARWSIHNAGGTFSKFLNGRARKGSALPNILCSGCGCSLKSARIRRAGHRRSSPIYAGCHGARASRPGGAAPRARCPRSRDGSPARDAGKTPAALGPRGDARRNGAPGTSWNDPSQV